MTAHRFLGIWGLRHACIGAAVLLWAGLVPAAAQFPPPPGQTASANQGTNPFPPPPGQQFQKPAANPFPSPGQASASPGGFGSPASGGFGSPAQGGFGGSPQSGGFVRPGGFSQPQGGGGMGGPPGGVPPAQRVCLDFPAIKEDVEKGAATIRTAGEKKLSREQVCPLFKVFAAKEERLVKFLTTNQKLCGVPPNIVTQVKQNHAKTLQIRNNVCSTAPVAAAAPSLSDALGGPIIADDTSVKSGRGTFDTLTGNALQR